MITEKISTFVKNECEKPQNKLGSAFFKEHVLIVKEYACHLAQIFGADKEIVELASYLHDISAVIDINTLSCHAELSAQVAETILKGENYPTERIERIKKVISAHSSPVPIGEGTYEEICVSNADAIAQVVNPSYWLYFAFSIRNMNYEQAIEWYQNLVRKNMDCMIVQAKQLVEKNPYFMDDVIMKK